MGAVNNGGPTESIVDGETGFLRPATPEEWARAMELLLDGATVRASHMRRGASSEMSHLYAGSADGQAGARAREAQFFPPCVRNKVRQVHAECSAPHVTWTVVNTIETSRRFNNQTNRKTKF